MPLDDEHVRSLAKMLETMADDWEENGHKLASTYQGQATIVKQWVSMAYRLRLASRGLKP
jgi:hypothetical protein